jgi:hypothetical protein
MSMSWYAASACARAVAGIAKAEDAVRTVAGDALDEFSVRVSRTYGIAFRDLVDLKPDVLDSLFVSHDVPRCQGRTAGGGRCKLRAACDGYCAAHREQGDEARRKKRRLEMYVHDIEKATAKVNHFDDAPVVDVSARCGIDFTE